MAEPTRTDSVTVDPDDEYEAFRRRFLTLIGGSLTFATTAFVTVWLVGGVQFSYAIWVIIGIGVCAAGLVLARSERIDASATVLVFGIATCVGGFLLVVPDPVFIRVGVEALYMIVIFSAFLGTVRVNYAYGAVAVALLIATAYRTGLQTGDVTGSVTLGITDIVHFMITWLGATAVAGHLRRNRRELRDRFVDIQRVVTQAQKIATGDLSAQIERNNEVSEVVADMLDGLKSIVTEVQRSVNVMGSASSEISTMTVQQERGAVHQASAVRETRETIESLAQASQTIADASSNVLRNAEATQRTSETANQRILALSRHTKRINELLEVIRDIARKSEILALNAALEGSRAGEVGRGFSLVAGQMRQLAESTAGTLKNVKELTTDITKSTNETVLAIEEATKLAADTNRSAREISLVTQQQGSSVRQVIDAMLDIARITDEFAESSKDTLRAVQELKELNARLDELAHRFVV